VPDDLSALLEAVFAVGRSSRYGMRRRRIFGAASAPRESFASPLKAGDAGEAARRARALRLAGRDDEAAEGFERALALDPRCAAAWAYRWESRWSPRSSPAGIERAASLAPKEPVWRIWRGLAALASRGDERSSARAARRHFMDALSLGPSPLAWAGLALAESRGGRPAAAAAAAGKAISGEPRQGWLFRLRAVARLHAGDEAGFLDDARREALLDEGIGTLAEVFPSAQRRPGRGLIAAADRFLARRPNAHWMLTLRGDCKRSPMLNDFAGAVADFTKAAALKPDCAFTQAYLSRALMVDGQTQAALEAIDRAVRLAPGSGWLRVWRGEVQRRLGELDAAMADFDAGLRLDPDYEMGYAWRGGARRALGRLDEAIEDLNLAAALEPNYAWTFAELSLAHRGGGRFSLALRDLERAAGLDAKHVWCARPQDAPSAILQLDAVVAYEPKNAWAWAWRGETRLRHADASGAVRDLRRAVALDPRLSWPRAWLGQALVALGRPREALRAFNGAIARDARYAPALAERGRLLLSLGRIRAAWSDLCRAAAAGPLSSRTWQSKGEAGLRLRRWKEAAGDFSKALELDRGWRPRLGRAAAYEKLGLHRLAREDLSVPVSEARRLAGEGRHAEAALILRELKAALPRVSSR